MILSVWINSVGVVVMEGVAAYLIFTTKPWKCPSQCSLLRK